MNVSTCRLTRCFFSIYRKHTFIINRFNQNHVAHLIIS